MSIFKNIFGKRPTEMSIDSIRFDVSKYTFQSEEPGMRVWSTEKGDRVGLYYFSNVPDLPKSQNETELRAFYQTGLDAIGGSVVECAVFRIAGVGCIWSIFKIPQN